MRTAGLFGSSIASEARSRNVRRSILYALAGVGLLFLITTLTPLVPWWAAMLAGPFTNPPGEVLIVLSADGPSADGILAENSYWRSVYAVRAWREGSFREVVISGGPGADGGEPICETMRRFLASEGVPPEKIRLERRSRDTHENALFTTAMVGREPGRKILLTSDYHMFRAIGAFRKAGLAGVASRPIPDVLKRAGHWPARSLVFTELIVETIKIVYYAARGWI